MRTVTHKVTSYIDQSKTIPMDTVEYSDLDQKLYDKQIQLFNDGKITKEQI